MKLYLAAAVLMLAFVTQTEAQDDLTVEERLNQFGAQVTEFTKDLASKTQTAFEQINNSEFATTTRDWFTEQFGKVKAQLGGSY